MSAIGCFVDWLHMCVCLKATEKGWVFGCCVRLLLTEWLWRAPGTSRLGLSGLSGASLGLPGSSGASLG